MGARPKRFTHFCRFLHPVNGVKRPATACRYMRHHILSTTEGSLPITALYYGFEISDPLVLDAKDILALEGDVYQVFPCSDDMIRFAGLFPVFRGISPNACGMFFRRYLLTGKF